MQPDRSYKEHFTTVDQLMQHENFPEGIDIHELLTRLPAVLKSINDETQTSYKMPKYDKFCKVRLQLDWATKKIIAQTDMSAGMGRSRARGLFCCENR